MAILVERLIRDFPLLVGHWLSAACQQPGPTMLCVTSHTKSAPTP